MTDAMSAPIGGVAAEQAAGEERRTRIPYDDLREWLVQAEALGEVEHIKGASWQEEIGHAVEIGLHADSAPCLLFDEVPGCSKGHRVLAGFFGGTRKNMTLGFPPEMNKLELSQAFLETYLRDL